MGTQPGKVALVTGASSGIGAELARQLGAAGWKVGMLARRSQELEAVAAAIRDRGGSSVWARADMADPSSIRQGLDHIVESFGPVDLLIANAGMALPTTGVEFSAERFERMARVNLIGVAYAIEAVLPSMIQRRSGQIVGISSLAAYRGLPGSSGYCATKAGLSTLLEGLRPELKRLGVHITTVHPGYIRTPMTAEHTHFQPLLMEVEPAVRRILRGVARRQTRVDFPRRMAALLSLIQLLPDPIYDRISARILLGRPDSATPLGSEPRS